MQEYRELCQIIGGIPRGDCQLVALYLSKVIPSSIVEGKAVLENRSIEHYWLRSPDGEDIDPLSEDWDDDIVRRECDREISPERIVWWAKEFFEEFPKPSGPLSLQCYPCRWKLGKELNLLPHLNAEEQKSLAALVGDLGSFANNVEAIALYKRLINIYYSGRTIDDWYRVFVWNLETKGVDPALARGLADIRDRSEVQNMLRRQ